MKLILVAANLTWGWMLRLSIVLILVLALLLCLGRLFLPRMADQHRADLAQGISEFLGVPVTMQSLAVTWQGWEPTVRLKDFSLRNPDDEATLVSFEQALVSLDVGRSVLAGRPILNNIHLQGNLLILERGTDDRLRLIPQSIGEQPSQSIQQFAHWLFRINSLDLVFDTLQVRDASGDLPPQNLGKIRLSLRPDGDSQRVDLDLISPRLLGHTLRSSIKVEASEDDPAVWSGTFYVEGDNAALSALPLSIAPASGRIDTKVWGSWRKGRLMEMVVQAYARNLQPPNLPGTEPLRELMASLPGLRINFNWQRRTAGWQGNGDLTLFDARGTSIVKSALDLTMVEAATNAPRHLKGQLHDLRLQDLAALAAPWITKPQRVLLTDLAPKGELPELEFRVTLDEGETLLEQARSYTLSARFQELRSRAWKRVPGIAGLDGYLYLDQNGGELDFDPQSVQIDASALLPAPLILDTLTGSIQWHRETGRLRLKSPGLSATNPGFKAHLQGELTLFAGDVSPLLDLNMEFFDLDVAQIHHYLPATIMKPKLVAWLDQALVSGRVPTGSLIFRGHLADFPFDQGEGLFETRLRVRDTVFSYFPEWPRVEELDAEVVFRNRGMQIETVAGKIFDADLEYVHARMDDLKQGRMHIQGKVRGKGKTLLRFVRESPLVTKLGKHVTGMELAGENSLDLELVIPFRGKPIEVQGDLGFHGGNLRLAQWDVELEQLKGNLHFTRQGLTAKEIQLFFRSEPALLNAESHNRKDGSRETRFRVRSRLSTKTLLGQHADKTPPILNGKARWDILLVVPNDPGVQPKPSLTLSSKLEGVEVDLPPPFAKAATEQRNFQLRIDLGKEDTLQLRLNYEPNIQVALELADFRAKPRLIRGELRINAGNAKLPKTPGLSVLAKLPHFDMRSMAPWTGDKTGHFGWLSALDIYLDELIVGDQYFPRVHVQAAHEGNALILDLEGMTIAGSLHFPATPTLTNPVTVQLQRLALGNGGKKPETREPSSPSMDPRSVPPLSITVEDLSWKNTPLGRFSLFAIPVERGLRFDTIKLVSDHAEITARGDWLVANQGQLSSIQATFSSDDLGTTFEKLGYQVGLGGCETTIELTGNWPAPFADFSIELLDGELKLDSGKGQLLNIDPGVGRVAGLINLSSVARRLTLDFSDFFYEGLAFDEIKGNFSIKKGQAHTNDLYLEGPSARIDIDGQLSLKDGDLAKIITVTPRLSSSLPIAGTIAGGPVIGIAVFLAERVFQNEIDKFSSRHYKLTGSWGNPVIQPIEASSASFE